MLESTCMHNDISCTETHHDRVEVHPIAVQLAGKVQEPFVTLCRQQTPDERGQTSTQQEESIR